MPNCCCSGNRDSIRRHWETSRCHSIRRWTDGSFIIGIIVAVVSVVVLVVLTSTPIDGITCRCAYSGADIGSRSAADFVADDGSRCGGSADDGDALPGIAALGLRGMRGNQCECCSQSNGDYVITLNHLTSKFYKSIGNTAANHGPTSCTVKPA